MNKETNIYSFADECYVFYGDYKKDIEERDKKIDRLNNIINKLEKYLIDKCKYIDENNPLANDKSYITYRTEQKLAYQCILEKLKELKDSD